MRNVELMTQLKQTS